MYEDMTFENIMDSMMEDMPDGLDTSYISHRFPPFSKNNRECGLIHSLSDNNKPAIVS